MTALSWPEDVVVHPAAKLFPLLSGPAFAEFVEDIRMNGLTNSIVRTSDGHVLDGRNRLMACLTLKIEPTYQVYDGEPWTYVISTNLHRRHLTDAQRALIAAKIAERTHGDRGRKESSCEESFTERDHKPPTREQARHLLGVSAASLDRARQVVKHGTLALQRAVETAQVPIATAARVATEMPEVAQDEYVTKVEAGDDPRQAAPPARKRTTKNVGDDVEWAQPTGEASLVARTQRRRPQRQAIPSAVASISGLADALGSLRMLDAEIDRKCAAELHSTLGAAIRALQEFDRKLKERKNG